MSKPLSPVLVLLSILVSSSLGFAQDPRALATQREALKKLDSWVGVWKGSGWTRFGAGNKEEFTITETVQSKLDGLVLLVEGLGKGTDAAGKELVGHQALAVVSYDDKAKQFRFRHYTAQGRFGESELKVTDGGYEWGMSPEGSPVKIRFIIKLDGKKWQETGEFSQDGTNWVQFLEMNLDKLPARGK